MYHSSSTVSPARLAEHVGASLVSGTFTMKEGPPVLVCDKIAGVGWLLKDGETILPAAVGVTAQSICDATYIGSLVDSKGNSLETKAMAARVVAASPTGAEGTSVVKILTGSREAPITSWAYFMKRGNATVEFKNDVKVGLSDDPWKTRLATMQGGSTDPWFVVKAFGFPTRAMALCFEAGLHNLYEEHQVAAHAGSKKGEFFRLDGFTFADILRLPDNSPKDLIRYMAAYEKPGRAAIYNTLQQVLVEGNTTIETRHIGVAVSAETT